METSELIEVNSYIIIQRHGYFKLHQLVDKSIVMLGKDRVNLSSVVGRPYWSMFKMVPKKGNKREFDLEECSKIEKISEDIMKAVSYGTDNRNITDDGSSQSLSSEDINGMRESGASGQEILGKIVENSKTFKEKTEYSQEKYLKKKEKKYFEYIVIRKPSLRLLVDILYRDPLKIMGLRHDTLSQIFTAANIQHDGVYALFENGSQALVGAGILSYLSEQGLLINLTLGNNPQKQAILAMNFKKNKLSQLVNVKIKDIVNVINPKDIPTIENLDNKVNDGHINSPCAAIKTDECELVNNDLESAVSLENSGSNIEEKSENIVPKEEHLINDCNNKIKVVDGTPIKRKSPGDDDLPVKKPRWAEDFERATAAFTTRKLNGIVIVSKEYPLNIIVNLLPFLKPSCQLVVYCSFREPLLQLYLELKKRRDVIGIHLTENWLRMYQVLPNRTHPDVNMAFSGHLLIATKVI